MARRAIASTYVALLRGINVGGKNMLPMKGLAALFAAANCDEVRTFIQSGNVIFRAAPSVAAQIPLLIAAEIERGFGLRVPVVLRSAEEMNAVLSGNPFLQPDATAAPGDVEGKMLHVFFLADAPDAAAVEKLDPQRSSPDKYMLRGREIYARFSDGMAKTKLTNAYFDSKLKTISTARNWNTVLKLAAMMKP
jgi:uncharacterized protein (DUF1697 family)